VLETRRQWILLLCLFLISLPAVTPRIYSSDEIQYFAYLRSLWFDRDVSFDNEYRYFYDRDIARSDGFRETFLERTTEAGRRVNFGTIGCAILWSPFYGAVDLSARLLRAAGRPVAVDGFSKPYIAAVAYGSAFYGAAAIALAIAAGRRLGLRAFTSGMAVWFGTPLLFYTYVAPPMSHACSAFAVALFVYTWLRVRGDWSVRGAAALGATGALMAMVREQDLFFVAGPALDFGLWTFRRFREQRSAERARAGSALLRAAAAAIVFAVVFAPQAVAYVRLNGHLGPSRLVTRKMSWNAPHALEVLVSPEHGYFIWTPLALLAIAGLGWMAIRKDADGGWPGRDHRLVAACLLLMVALQIYVGGSVESWTVAGGFGQRRLVALSALLVIGLAVVREGVHRAAVSRVLTALVIVAVYWNVALSVEFAIGLMDRQKLSPRRNAYDAFVTLPTELPSIAWRYLFAGASFNTRPAGSARPPAAAGHP
jgi:hypothetical protein